MKNDPRWLQSLKRALFAVAIVATLSVGGVTFAGAVFPLVDETDEEQAAQEKAVARFLSLLEKSPRRGTALDRVYGHHVENGTLATFLADLKKKCQERPDDGASWMLLGLIESQRGQDAAAAEAFAKAESLRTDDPLASFYLGQSLIRVGMNPEATLALERAIERRPQRADSLEIFQQLGRLYQRAQKNDLAIRTWKKLEDLYPNDVRVLEQIAVSLAEEGDPAQAIERFLRVAELTADDYQKTNSLMQVAALQIQTGQKKKGIAGFEQLLSQLDPDGWLYAEVRNQIESAYLNSGDQDGLVKYYESRIQQHPDDLQAISRLAQFLNASARTAEAVVWQEKALKLAPSRADFRRQLIDLYLTQGQIGSALEQYRQLFAIAPQDVESLRDWGQLALKDPSKGIEERQKEATRIWHLIIESKPDDALTMAQTAELFQKARLFEQALSLYERAVSLAPNDPQYREYLGEFLHQQKRPEDAVRVWRENTAGPLRTAENLSRTAEICMKFGYTNEALDLINDASSIAPDDIAIWLTTAEYRRRAGQFAKSLEALLQAERLAETDEERDVVVRNRLDVLSESSTLAAEIERMAAAITSRPDATANDWTLLARYYEKNSQPDEAVASITQALKVEEQSIPALTTAARLLEASGDYAGSCEYSRRLAAVDRRSSAVHWRNVARLEGLLGNVDKSIQAAEQVIEAAPGSTSSYELLSEICFRFGQSDRGIKALRQAVRISGDDPQLTMSLATALSDQFRTEEAIEVYWRAFENSEVLEDQTLLIQKLVPLYQQLDQVDALLGRLERSRSDERQRRAMTICLAQAWQTLGDSGLARTELEKLLSEETRDTRLIRQLSILCHEMSDLDSAIRYQQQLVSLAEGEETEIPLAMLLKERGDTEQAEQIFLRLASRQISPVEKLKTIDSLIGSGSLETALQIVQPLVEREPDNWELQYRNGLLQIALGQNEAALRSLNAVLSTDLPISSSGILAASERKNLRPATIAAAPVETTEFLGRSAIEIYEMTMEASEVEDVGQLAEQWDSIPASVLAPPDFAAARISSLMWKTLLEPDSQIDSSNPLPKTATEIFDHFCLQLMRDDSQLTELSASLAQKPGASARLLLMLSLLERDTPVVPSQENRERHEEPLSAEVLDQLLDAHRAFLQHGGDILYSALPKSMIIHENACDYVMFGNSHYSIVTSGIRAFTPHVIAEMRLANRDDDAEVLLSQILNAARSADDFAGNIHVLTELKRYDQIPVEYQRWLTAARKEYSQELLSPSATLPINSDPRIRIALVLNRWIGILGEQDDKQQILQVLNDYLDVARLEGFRVRRTPHRSSRQDTTFCFFGDEGYPLEMSSLPGGSILPPVSKMILTQTFYTLEAKDSLAPLAQLLSQRIVNLPGDAGELEPANLALVLVMMVDIESAFDLMTAAAKRGKKDADAEFLLAELQMLHGNFQASLETLNAIIPLNQQMLEKRELAALILAQRLGDYPRATQAVEKLFGLRLNTEKELHLIEAARILGMKDVVSALVRRNERAAGNRPNAIGRRMHLLLHLGDREQALQLARRLLQVTQCPRIVSGLSVGQSYRHQVDPSRSQALALLKEAGELDAMISELQESLERSPDSMRLWDRLVEAVDANGNPESVIDLFKTAVERSPDHHAVRLAYASLLEGTEKEDASFREYQYLLLHSPKTLKSCASELYRSYRRAGRVRELIDLLYDMKDEAFGAPGFRLSIAKEVLDWSNDDQQGIRLLDKVILDEPESIRSHTAYYGDESLWKSDVFFRLAAVKLLPDSEQIQEDRMCGFESIYRNLAFSDLVELARSESRLESLRSVIAQHADKNPGWTGGVLLRNWIDLQTSRRSEALTAFRQLSSEKELLENLPTSTCWMIGGQLDLTADSRELAGDFIEAAVRQELAASGTLSRDAASHAGNLIENSRHEEARALLSAYVDPQRQEDKDPIRLATVLTYNRRAVAEVFLAHKMSMDAFNYALSILRDEETTKTANPYTLETPLNSLLGASSFQEQAFELLSRVFEQLKGQEAADALGELLGPASVPHLKGGIDLFFEFSESQEPLLSDRISMLESRLLKTLLEVCQDEQIRSSLNQKLDILCETYPEDISVAVVRTALRLKTNDPRAPAGVQDLVRRVNVAPVPSVAPGDVLTKKLRNQMTPYMGLWIVSRQLLQADLLPDEANALAQSAVEAAGIQETTEFSVSILMEWSRILLQKRQFDTAQKTLLRYLAVASSPRRLLSPELIARADDSESVAASEGPQFGASTAMSTGNRPLQISQFQQVLQIASIAAKHDLAELSQKAVRTAFAAGFPVPDLAERFDFAPLSNFDALLRVVGTDTVLYERQLAVTSIHALISEWRGPAYDRAVVAEILESLVFPASHPREIELFTLNHLLVDGRAENLATTLIAWELLAGREDALRSQIERRKASDPIRALVLSTLLNIRLEDTDKATLDLLALRDIVQQDKSATVVQLVCHAAIPASDVAELESVACEILEIAAEQSWAQATSTGRGSRTTSLSGLQRTVNQLLARSGNIKALENSVEESLTAMLNRRTFRPVRSEQIENLSLVANEAARAKAPATTMKFLGELADVLSHSGQEADSALALAAVTAHLRALEAPQRYEAWRNWTMPNEQRRNLRFVANPIPALRPPKALTDTLTAYVPLPETPLLSNLTELVDAAEACGQLDELKALAVKANGENVPFSKHLLSLIHFRRNEYEEGIQQFDSILNTAQSRTTIDFLALSSVVVEALRQPHFARHVIQRKKAIEAFAYMREESPNIPGEILKAERRLAGLPESAEELSTSHWVPVSSATPAAQVDSPEWRLHDDMIVHFSGQVYDGLLLDLPLRGDFDLTLEVLTEEGAAFPGFGGVLAGGGYISRRFPLHDYFGKDVIFLPGSLTASGIGWRTTSLQIRDGVMRYFANGVPRLETPVTTAVPWIVLSSKDVDQTVVRNLKIHGTPEILNAVKLLAEDRLDGWSCDGFGDFKPLPRQTENDANRNSDAVQYGNRQYERSLDWRVEHGELLGEPVPGAPSKQQSRIFHYRPLRAGDRLSYEFFYQPGAFVAHPSFGQLAVLLSPEGVKSHWISDSDFERSYLGLRENNQFIEPEYAVSSGAVLLRPGEWNVVELAHDASDISIRLNGQTVYRRPVSPELDLRPGIFRYKRQGTRVRNVTLTGDWPKEWTPELASGLLNSGRAQSPETRQTMESMLPRSIVMHTIPALMADASELAPEEARKKLSEWVLPSETHPDMRLLWMKYPMAEELPGDMRDIEIQSPALKLVSLAQATNTLSDLELAVNSIPQTADRSGRSKASMLALIAIAKKDWSAAREHCHQLASTLSHVAAMLAEAEQDVPEFLVAWTACEHPELWQESRELSHWLVKLNQARTGQSPGPFLNILQIRAELLRGNGPRVNQDDTLTQWNAVPVGGGQSQLPTGFPGQWLRSRGQVEYFRSSRNSDLYFQSPLEGNFEVHFRQRIGDRFRFALGYGDELTSETLDQLLRRLGKPAEAQPGGDAAVQRDTPDRMADVRVIVNNKKLSVQVDGTEILSNETHLPRSPWPYLLDGAATKIQDFRIIGSPAIPRELNLLAPERLHCWKSGRFSDHVSWIDQPTATHEWARTGDELLVERIARRQPTESLITYQRPMLEDGEFSYEVFWESGQLECSPAIGRTAIVLTRDGARRHEITWGDTETRDLAADNSESIPDAAEKISFRERDWNEVRLTVKDSVATVLVNDAAVASFTVLDSPNERFFGFFRYANLTGCRVRNVKYRGNWPKQLPSVEDQELAWPQEFASTLTGTDSSALGSVETIDFRLPLDQLKAAGAIFEGDSNGWSRTDQGLRSQVNNSDAATSNSLRLAKAVDGDFMMTLDYQDLQAAGQKSNDSPSLVMSVNFHDASWRAFVVEATPGDSEGKAIVASAEIWKRASDGQPVSEDRMTNLNAQGTGRLRIVRRGAELITSFAKPGETEFRLLQRFTIGAAPLESIGIAHRKQDQPSELKEEASSTVTIRKLEIITK